MPFFKGEVAEGPRKEIFYCDDNGNLNALRYGPWKIHFAWIEGNLFSGKRTSANVPLVVNLRADPFERAPFESDMYLRWHADKLWTLVPAQIIAGKFIGSFKDYPPSQRVGSMNLDVIMEQLQSGASGAGK
jgi:arylsulfatase